MLKCPVLNRQEESSGATAPRPESQLWDSQQTCPACLCLTRFTGKWANSLVSEGFPGQLHSKLIHREGLKTVPGPKSEFTTAAVTVSLLMLAPCRGKRRTCPHTCSGIQTLQDSVVSPTVGHPQAYFRLNPHLDLPPQLQRSSHPITVRSTDHPAGPHLGCVSFLRAPAGAATVASLSRSSACESVTRESGTLRRHVWGAALGNRLRT